MHCSSQVTQMPGGSVQQPPTTALQPTVLTTASAEGLPRTLANSCRALGCAWI